MKIGILRVGRVESDLKRIQESLKTIFMRSKPIIIAEEIPIPDETFAETRKQYRSDVILKTVRSYTDSQNCFNRVLGIVDVDIFVPKLNFVFGQAECPGKSALVSLWRLRPEFYGNLPNKELFDERSAKEAVHELGHTLGLDHCSNPFCAMHFSNSIYDTDVKQSLFCEKCSVKSKVSISRLGKTLEREV